MRVFEVVVAALTGCAVGSFLNVVIWRLPRGESLMHPGSRCPKCGTGIAWFDNVPLLSWVLLRARCRKCRAPISARYPLVEALTGALFALAMLRYEADLGTAVVAALVLATLVAVSFIDLDTRLIPDRITKPAMALAVPLALLAPELHPADWIHGLKPGLNAMLHAGAGIAAGLLVIYAVRFVGGLLLGREAMGLGDAKLLGMIGGYVGPAGTLYTLALACLSGTLIHGFVVLLTGGRPKPLVLTLHGAGGKATFSEARVRKVAGPDRASPAFLVEVVSDRPAPEGPVEATAVLPALRVLEDADVTVRGKGTVTAGAASGGAHAWQVRVEGLGEREREHLEVFAQSHKYLPFGPYLALGGAVVVLYGTWVDWAITEAYPRWARSLFS